jgi:lipopolysaccharide/colanic/teichoic acid biosynthesis glycosyltransferase
MGAGAAAHAGFRGFDIVVGFLVLLLVLPIMLVVAALIYIEDGGPIFFVQPRIGLGGGIFNCIKFRSMSVNADDRLANLLRDSAEARWQWAQNRKLQRDPRVTVVGRFIRRWSVDELPQLINVMTADMNLVGPRPIMVEEAGIYGRRLSRYKTVRPGLTGLWQVNGRANASFRSRVAMDMVYIRRRSHLMDIGIFLSTIPVVVLGRGSY